MIVERSRERATDVKNAFLGEKALPAELLENLKWKIASCEHGGGWFWFGFVVFFYDLLARGEDRAGFTVVFLLMVFIANNGMLMWIKIELWGLNY